MKRILIVSDTFLPSGRPNTEPTPLHADSVVDLDDNAAGQIIASGRGREVDPEEVALKDTTKARNKAAAERATATPENMLAAAIATAVAAAVPAAIEAAQASAAATAAAAATEASAKS
jgi:hypothetical protein